MADQSNGVAVDSQPEKQHTPIPSGEIGVAPQNTADSTTDNGQSRRPRDARIVHLILASMGVHAYHERVPLQIMDFAYRYTSAVLQDALIYADVSNSSNAAGINPPSTITAEDLRMSIASRVNHQFNTSLPKEFLLDIAQERNKIALPPVDKGYGIRLPPEKYCLTGVNWELVDGDEFWTYDDEDEDEDGGDEGAEGGGDGMDGVVTGAGEEGADEDAQGEDDDMNVDDLFGGGGGNGGVKDEIMADV